MTTASHPRTHDSAVGQEEPFYRLLEFLPIPVLVSRLVGHDARGRHLNVTEYVNREYLRVIGYTTLEAPDINASFRLKFPDRTYRQQMRSQWERNAREALAGNGRPAKHTAKIRCKDGSDRWFNVVSDITGQVCPNHHVIAFLDVTEQIDTQRQLKELSQTDLLTGLKSRRAMIDEVDRAVGECGRRGHPLTLTVGDIDCFKPINDRFGHEVGDEALVYVARVLEASIRRHDSVGRWGGEEFLLLLPDTTPDRAAGVVTRIQKTFNRQCFWHRNGGAQLTMTLGLAGHDFRDTFDATLRKADAALYQGKAAGRNCLVVFGHDPIVAPLSKPALGADPAEALLAVDASMAGVA